MPEKPSKSILRERKIASRLEQILESAARLFASKGFHRTTTKEIAEAADISEGSLYNYFSSKNELLTAIVAQLASSLPDETLTPDISSQDIFRVFSNLIHERKDFIDRFAPMHQSVLAEILTDAELRQRYYDQFLNPTLSDLEKQLKLRLVLEQIRPVDPGLTARVIASLLLGLFILQISGDQSVQTRWDELVDLTASILIKGLQSEGNLPQKSLSNTK